jgi:rubredoxin
MTRRRPGAPGHIEAASACPVCGNTLEKRQNPSYGTGLAVHPYILVCSRCGWVNLEAVAATVAPVSAPAPRRGFFAWLGLRRRN